MLDLKLLRDRPDEVQTRLDTRGSYDLSSLLDLDRQVRDLEQKRSALQAESNSIGKQVGEQMKTAANSPEVQALRDRGSQLKAETASLEQQERELRASLDAQLLSLPNLPDASTPVGRSEADNLELRRWGDQYLLQGQDLRPHWEIGEALGILNFERATKIAQSRFVALQGLGAALERALISFMLDTQIGAGYLEVMPPLLVNTASLTGSGQLPKFAEESFQCSLDDLWLLPTSEVPLVNLYRDETLSSDDLPLRLCAYTPCFRREAGSYGRDTRGLIRLHQFNKVELVKLTHPETSMQELESLTANAEAILQALKLPYRVLALCSGDLGFASARTYDLEVWLPSQGKYREISSCSNCLDFQARRANIRFKESGKKGTQFVHTLNGSGLAVGRTMAAVLENYQQPDGSVKVPEVLQPYLGGRDLIA